MLLLHLRENGAHIGSSQALAYADTRVSRVIHQIFFRVWQVLCTVKNSHRIGISCDLQAYRIYILFFVLSSVALCAL